MAESAEKSAPKASALSTVHPCRLPRLTFGKVTTHSWAHHITDTRVYQEMEEASETLPATPSVVPQGRRDSRPDLPPAHGASHTLAPYLTFLLCERSLSGLPKLEDAKSSEQSLAQSKYSISGSYCHYSLKPTASSEKAR